MRTGRETRQSSGSGNETIQGKMNRTDEEQENAVAEAEREPETAEETEAEAESRDSVKAPADEEKADVTAEGEAAAEHQEEPQHEKEDDGILDRFFRLFHSEPKDKSQLADVIHEARESVIIDANTHDMIEGVFEISELRVRDIMIPRSQIIVVHDDDTEENILSIIASSRHSRYPVVGEDIDEIKGLLIAKDLLIYRNTHPKTFNIADFMRPATVIPESVRVDRLLRKFQKERYHLAVVVDEFGSVSGLVTIEDALEQIVGDIADEGEKSGTDNIKAVNSSSYLISGVTPIEDFNEKFGTEFSNDDAETIAGLLIKTCGHLPVKGETIVLAGKFKFRVVNADKRRVKQLELRLVK